MITGEQILNNYDAVYEELSIGDIRRIVDEIFYCVIVPGFIPTEEQVRNVQAFFLHRLVTPQLIYNFITALNPVIQKDETNGAGVLFLRNPQLVQKLRDKLPDGGYK